MKKTKGPPDKMKTKLVMRPEGKTETEMRSQG